uniref:Uncharacterized protein AlNc14C77G5130 n=1 Tax=Albugo laibachii Nc14 TaxID=890382 RepID=F0WET0_9STRA|nr:conserved hypothetical protein [Albugo laibachii Nc14]|eukprot:CCA19712.1 conserved hypothetical protein [Albugo laibachii Nc14]
MPSSVESQLILRNLTQYIRSKAESGVSIEEVFHDIQCGHSNLLGSDDFHYFLRETGILKRPHLDQSNGYSHQQKEALACKQTIVLRHCMSLISGRQSPTITMKEFCSFFARQLRSKKTPISDDKIQHSSTPSCSPENRRASVIRKRKPTLIAPLESPSRLEEKKANKSVCELKIPPQELPATSQPEFIRPNALSKSDFAWRLFHVDSKTVIPFAILQIDDIMQRRSAETSHIHSERNNLGTTPISRQKYEYRFTIYIGVCQTIDSLKSFLVPLLTQFPDGKILICGFPTQTDQSLPAVTEDLLASWYAKLLAHLMSTSREWLVQPKDGFGQVNQYLIGFGLGAAVAIAILTDVNIKRNPSIRVFAGTLSAVMVVNGILEMNYSKQVDLRSKPASGTPHTHTTQANIKEPQSALRELLLSNLTSPDWITCLDHLQLPNFQSWPLFLPLIIVHGERNLIVQPEAVHTLLKKLRYNESEFNTCISKAWRMSKLREHADMPLVELFLHIAWLPCGHNALEECPNEMYDLFVKLILLDKEQIYQEGDTDHEEDSSITESKDADMLDTVLEPLVAALMQRNGIKWVQQELYNRGAEGRGSTNTILMMYQRVLRIEEQSRRSIEAKEAMRSERCLQREANRALRLEEATMRVELEKRLEAEKNRKQFQSDVNAMRATINARTMQQRLQIEREAILIEDAMATRMRREWLIDDRRKASNVIALAHMREIQLERVQRRSKAIALENEKSILALQQTQRRSLLEAQISYHKRHRELDMVIIPDTPNTFDCILDLQALVLRADALIEALDFFQDAIQKQAFLKTQAIKSLNLLQTQVPRFSEAKKTIEICSFQMKIQLKEKKLSLITLLLKEANVALTKTKHEADMMPIYLKQGMKLCDSTILSLRSDYSNLENESVNLSLRKDAINAKIDMLEDEYQRCLQSDATFYDSFTQSHGVCQRFGRRALLKKLRIEIEIEKGLLYDLNKTDAFQKNQQTEKEKQIDTWRAHLTRLEECVGKVRKRLSPLHPPEIIKNDRESNPGRYGGSLAEQVRCKPHANRSLEERQWLALDYKLHPAFYRGLMDSALLELLDHHEDYAFDTFGLTLSLHELKRIASLPSPVNLATAFLKCPQELQAYRLLHTYTYEDGDAHYAEEDLAFNVSCSNRPAIRVARSLEMLERLLKEKVDNPNAMAAGQRVVYSRRVTKVTLLECTNELEPRQIVTHSFELPSEESFNATLDLTVSLSFHGYFAKDAHQNGRVATVLQVIPGEGRRTDAYQGRMDEPIDIGKCLTESITLCTSKTIGKLLILHDPITKPLHDAKGTIYQVVVGAPVPTTYSIKIEATQAPYLDDALVLEKEAALAMQNQSPLLCESIKELVVSVMLIRRKLDAAKKLLLSSRQEVLASELAALKEQEADDGCDARMSKLKATQLDITFTKACFLYTKRENQVREYQELMHSEMCKLAQLLLQREAAERALLEFQLYLPSIEALLNGDGVLRGSQCYDNAELDTTNLSCEENSIRENPATTETLRRKYEHAHKRLVDKLDRDEVASLPLQHSKSGEFEPRITQSLDMELIKLLEVQLRRHKEDPTFDPLDWETTNVSADSSIKLQVDSRCRDLYREIQRCNEDKGPGFIDSKILHDTTQRFPVDILRDDLEKELSQLIQLQLQSDEEEQLKVFLRSLKHNAKSLKGIAQIPSSSVMPSISDTVNQGTRPHADENSSRTSTALNRTKKTRQIVSTSLNEKRYGCVACQKATCQWKAYMADSKASISLRLKTLRDEVNRVLPLEKNFIVSSLLCPTAIRQYSRREKASDQPEKYSASMRTCDLIVELQAEIKVLEKHLLLHEIDSEFHASFQPRHDETTGQKSIFYVTRALHGFPQAQEEKTAQKALDREHSVLAASLTTHEVLEDILQDMLDGWIFGEYNQQSALGLTSLADAQIPFSLVDLRHSSPRSHSVLPEVSEEALPLSSPQISREWVPKEWEAMKGPSPMKLAHAGSQREKTLYEIEQNLKFGLFYLVFMRFRAVALLSKQKRLWTDPSPSRKALKNGREREEIRDSRNAKLQTKRKAAHRARLIAETRQAKRELCAVKCIQRAYRKHCGQS